MVALGMANVRAGMLLGLDLNNSAASTFTSPSRWIRKLVSLGCHPFKMNEKKHDSPFLATAC